MYFRPFIRANFIFNDLQAPRKLDGFIAMSITSNPGVGDRCSGMPLLEGFCDEKHRKNHQPFPPTSIQKGSKKISYWWGGAGSSDSFSGAVAFFGTHVLHTHFCRFPMCFPPQTSLSWKNVWASKISRLLVVDLRKADDYIIFIDMYLHTHYPQL